MPSEDKDGYNLTYFGIAIVIVLLLILIVVIAFIIRCCRRDRRQDLQIATQE